MSMLYSEVNDTLDEWKMDRRADGNEWNKLVIAFLHGKDHNVAKLAIFACAS